MTDLETLLRSTYRTREDDVDVDVAQRLVINALSRPHRRRPRPPSLSSAVLAGLSASAVIVAVALALIVPRISGTPTVDSVRSTIVYGSQTTSPLTIQPPNSTTAPPISKSRARQLAEHPFSEPALDGGPVLFALGQVSASAGVGGPSGSVQPNNELAWVAVYKVKTNGDTSCPAEPPKITKRTPPVFKHYYFAVIVNAQNGATTTWNEDMSGLILRECAGAAAQ